MGETLPLALIAQFRVSSQSPMSVKCNKRKKDGKIHRYWSVMESYRLADGRSAKRQALYLGEINDSPRLAWCKTMDAFEGKTKKLPRSPSSRKIVSNALSLATNRFTDW